MPVYVQDSGDGVRNLLMERQVIREMLAMLLVSHSQGWVFAMAKSIFSIFAMTEKKTGKNWQQV